MRSWAAKDSFNSSCLFPANMWFLLCVQVLDALAPDTHPMTQFSTAVLALQVCISYCFSLFTSSVLHSVHSST